MLYNKDAILYASTTAIAGHPPGSLTSTLDTLNPLRYRGYVYDTETGFYYLHSRYYDPTTGRFINADSDTAGAWHNMYVYCDNKPIVCRQNSSVLRSFMDGRPIRDISPYPMEKAGILGAERELLIRRGYVYKDGYWIWPK